MEDWRLEFPKVSDVEIVFGGYPKGWFDAVLKTEEAEEDRTYESMASNLFFNGGTIPINKNLPEEYLREGI